MGIGAVIIGESASGKSSTMRNCDPKALAIFNVADKPFPFKQKFPMVIATTDVNQIVATLKRNTTNMYVIDDSQYLLVNEFFDRAKEAGYQKYTDMALNFRNLIHDINRKAPDDVVFYFLHHTEFDSNSGKVKAKTVGKMIDQYLTLEGCFDIVLLAQTDGKEHYFITQSDGYTTAKSPAGMFPDVKIDNDLKLVDDSLRTYWGL
jgi:hypothetical protein